MKNLSQNSQNSQTLYLEVQHKWTGEIRYFGDTVPASVNKMDWYCEKWNGEGFDPALWECKILKVLR